MPDNLFFDNTGSNNFQGVNQSGYSQPGVKGSNWFSGGDFQSGASFGSGLGQIAGSIISNESMRGIWRSQENQRKITETTTRQALQRLFGIPFATKKMPSGWEAFTVQEGSRESRYLPVGTLMPSVKNATTYLWGGAGESMTVGQMIKKGILPTYQDMHGGVGTGGAGVPGIPNAPGGISDRAGYSGKEWKNASPEEIRAEVEKYMQANPGKVTQSTWGESGSKYLQGIDPQIVRARERINALMEQGDVIDPKLAGQLNQSVSANLGRSIGQGTARLKDLSGAMTKFGEAGTGAAQSRYAVSDINKQFQQTLANESLQYIGGLHAMGQATY